jgi:hypothetical protein
VVLVWSFVVLVPPGGYDNAALMGAWNLFFHVGDTLLWASANSNFKNCDPADESRYSGFNAIEGYCHASGEGLNTEGKHLVVRRASCTGGGTASRLPPCPSSP